MALTFVSRCPIFQLEPIKKQLFATHSGSFNCNSQNKFNKLNSNEIYAIKKQATRFTAAQLNHVRRLQIHLNSSDNLGSSKSWK